MDVHRGSEVSMFANGAWAVSRRGQEGMHLPPGSSGWVEGEGGGEEATAVFWALQSTLTSHKLLFCKEEARSHQGGIPGWALRSRVGDLRNRGSPPPPALAEKPP